MKRARSDLFRFYSKLLKEHEKIEIVSSFFSFFMYIQLLVFQFLPYFIMNEQGSDSAAFIVNLFIRYMSDFQYPDNSYIFPTYIFVAAFGVVHLIFYLLERRKSAVKGIFIQIRNLIFLYDYYIIAYPIHFHIGARVRDFRYLGIDMAASLAILYDVIALIFLYTSAYFTENINTDTPMSGSGFIPSRYLPDHFMFKSFVFDCVIMTISIAGFNIESAYFFCGTMIIANLKRFVSIWKRPFYSKTKTNLSLSLYIAAIIIQIANIIILRFEIEHNAIMVAVAVGLYIIIYGIVYGIRTTRSRKIINYIIDKDYDSLFQYDAEEIIQYLDGNRIVINLLVNYLKNAEKSGFNGILSLMVQVYTNQLEKDNLNVFIEHLPYCQGFLISHIVFKINLKNHVDDKEKINSHKFWVNMIENKIDEALYDLFKEVEKPDVRNQLIHPPTETQNVEYLVYMKESMMKMNNCVISVIFLLIYGACLLVPTFYVLIIQGQMYFLPDSLKLTEEIVLKWYKLSYMITQGSNCTFAANITCDETDKLININYEPPDANCTTINSYYPDSSELAKDISNDLNFFAKTLAVNDGSKFNDLLINIWLKPIILFYEKSTDNSAFMSIRGILTYYNALIAATHPNPGDNICKSRVVQLFRDDLYNFINISQEIFDAFSQSTSSYVDFVQGIASGYDMYLLGMRITSIVFLLISAPVYVYWLSSQYKFIYNTLKKNFQITYYPFDASTMENNESNSSLDIKRTIRRSFYIYMSLALLFFILLNVTTQFSSIFLTDMANEYKVVILLDNVSLTLIHCLQENLFLYLFPENTSLKGQILGANELEKSIQSLNSALSVDNLRIFNDYNYPDLLKVNSIDLPVVSYHDIYSKFILTQQFEVFNFFNTEIPLGRLIYPGSPIFIHCHHMYLSHFSAQINELSGIFLEYTVSSLNEINLMIQINFLSFAIFIVVAIMTFYIMQNKFHLVFLLMNRYILELDQYFIASQQSLMTYLVDEKYIYLGKDLKDMEDLLTASDILMVQISKNNTINGVTKPVLNLFGYKADQVIGQKLTLLIPEKDNHSLYHGLHTVIDRTFNANGITNFGNNFPIQINKKCVDNKILLEIKSLEQVSELEELVQLHNDLYSEIFHCAFPSHLISPKFHFNENGTKKQYNHYAILIMMCETANEDQRLIFQSIASYYSQAIVLYATCSDCCLIFVEDNPVIKALKCYKGYQSNLKGGCIIEGDKINIATLNIPDSLILENFDDPLEYLLTISVEPLINIGKFINNIQDIKPGLLGCTESLKNLIGDQNIILSANNLVYFDNKTILDLDMPEEYMRCSHSRYVA